MITLAAVAAVGSSLVLHAQSFNPIFGSQPVGTTSAPHALTLTNPDGLFAEVLGFESTTGPFEADNGCGNTILAPHGLTGDSCTTEVRFSPTTVGPQTGTLTITIVTDLGPLPITTPLTGTGIGVPAVRLSPASETFPKQVVDSSSAPQAIVLTNVGTASLDVSGVTVTGPDASDFGPVTSTCAIVVPNRFCKIGVTFTPRHTATRTATLLVNDNASGSPQPVPLSGIGVASCDINGHGLINVLDVQLEVDQVLGIFSPTGDINGDGVVNVADVQLVVNAALGLGCNH